MNKDNTDKLYKDFPELYAQRTLSVRNSAMPWGFDCGDGWFDIIYKLSKQLSDLNIGVQAVQVKEKYGTLRFYVNGYNDEVSKLINEAERESAQTCEVCGMPGKIIDNDWLECRCSRCLKI